MGVVYRAAHRDTADLVALKTIAIPNELLLSSVRREIHALARIRHPGIVRIVGEGVEDGVPWYAMEIVDGVTLREYPRRSEGGLLGVLGVVRKLCGALAFLHGEGLVHRDLKPDNILVLQGGNPVIVDFGLAARFGGAVSREELGLAEEGLGTIAYASPEQLRGESVDARADLYSLGCVLYELLTSEPPFSGTSLFQVVRRHLEDAPSPPSLHARCESPDGVPPELDALVLRLLAKDPAARLGYADDVAAALAKLGARDETPNAPRPRSYLYRPRFAGRDETMAAVDPHLSRLDAGGGVLFVGGESGVGKTRLALQIARRARESGVRVLSGECLPPLSDDAEHGAGAAPLQALRRPLEAIADGCRGRGAGATMRIVGPRARLLTPYAPAFAGLPGQAALPEPTPLPPAEARLRLFTCLRDTLEAFAESDPVLLVLDDLQWADELTLGFLEFAVARRSFEDVPVLVLGTYRVEEVGQALRALLESPHATRLALGRLGEAAVASIVGDMLALSPPPAALSRFLGRQSEGNPFFVAEYLRTAVEEGVLRRSDEGVWQALADSTSGEATAGYDRLGFPAGLRDLVTRRLRGLPPEATEAVAAAAVLGREVALPRLELVAGLESARFADALDELLRRQVLEEAEPGLLRFVHDKLREMAYDDLAPQRRAALHGAAARAIEAGEAEPALLGHHWAQAGDRDRARQYFLVAARDAKTRHANREAERLYRAHLDLVDAPTAETVRARTELAVNVLSPLGRTAEAFEQVERALAEMGPLEDAAIEAQCWRSLGVISWETGRLDGAVAAYERALAIARETGDGLVEARTLVNLGNAHLHRGRPDTARTLYERALAIDQETGARQHEGVTLGNLGILHFDAGEFDEARAYYERALAIAREVGDRRSEGRHLGNIALLLCNQRRFEEGSAYYERALAVARAIGDRREEGIILGNLSDYNTLLGRIDDARDQYRQSLAIHQETGNKRFEAEVFMSGSITELRAGRLDEAEALLERARPLVLEIGDTSKLAEWQCRRGEVALARGESALQYLEGAREAAGSIGEELTADLRTAIEALAEAQRRHGER
jgi:eukaryotic-like serine/threonine-protein kinase